MADVCVTARPGESLRAALPVLWERHAVGDVHRQLDADALLGRFGDRPDRLRARRHRQPKGCTLDTSFPHSGV